MKGGDLNAKNVMDNLGSPKCYEHDRLDSPENPMASRDPFLRRIEPAFDSPPPAFLIYITKFERNQPIKTDLDPVTTDPPHPQFIHVVESPILTLARPFINTFDDPLDILNVPE